MSGFETTLRRLFALWLELNTPYALTVRPSGMSGRPALKKYSSALTHDQWISKAYDKPINQRFKSEVNFTIVDLQSEFSEFVWSWSDYCAELLGLPETWAKPRPEFLLFRVRDIEKLEVAADFLAEMKQVIGHAENALGYGISGVVCSCGVGRMQRDDFGTYMCSSCTVSFTAAQIDNEIRNSVSLREAAQILNVKVGTLRQRVSRANISPINDAKPFIYRLADLQLK